MLGAADGRVYWARGDTLNWVDVSSGEQRAIDLPGAEWAARDNALVTPGEHPAGFVRDGDCLFVIHTAVECTDRGAIIGAPLVEGAVCARLDVRVNGLQPRPFAADAEQATTGSWQGPLA